MQIRTDSFADAYELFEDLGSGQFAVVKRCKEKITCKEYAAKFVIKRRANSSSRKGLFREKILQEIEILSELKHNNIISLHDVFETNQEIILVIELVSGGELFEYISEKDHLSEEEAARFITQILEGVEHFHAKNIVHLDLKPENVMLLDRNDCLIKIIDFGISRKLKPGEKVMETYGTPEFVAPEIIQYQPISTATDMWSIGVITYILLSGASPFLGDSKQETFANITNIDYSFDDEYFGHTSDLAKDFIARLFVKDVRKRANIKDCLEHPWIKPRRRQDEDLRRQAQINIDQFKSFIARRRWKVQMHCESRTVRTVTTKYRDSEGNIKSKKRAELTGKSVMYEGEYSETDSEAENEHNIKKEEREKVNVRNIDPSSVDKLGPGINSLKLENKETHENMFRRQKCRDVPNIEMKPVKVTEFNESIDEKSDDEEADKRGLDESQLKAKINDHLSIKNSHHQDNLNTLPSNLISDESKEDEKSDVKVIDTTDEKTGQLIRTSIENKMKTNENVKVCKGDDVVDVQETDDAIVKKITTKTRTTKSVVKTTTTTTTKKVSLCNKIIRKYQLRLSSTLSLENINCVSFGKNLFDNGDDFVLNALLCAAEEGDVINLKELLELASLDVNKRNKNKETALHYASSAGKLDIIKLLHTNSLDLHARDINNENAIHYCCRCSSIESAKLIIQYLVKNNVSLDVQNKNGESPMHIASRYGCCEIVRFLCEFGANLDIEDDQHDTCLHVASWHGFPEIVKYLCHFGCDVNLKNKEGETALIVACARGCIESVKALIEHKADLNCHDKRGNTALHWAVRRHYTLIALLLIQAECQMDVLDSNGETALHIACRENLLPVVQTMCALGCRVDIKNNKQMTPLHTATEKNEIDAVRCLCLAGLDLSITNKDGLTAEQLASNLKHSNIANLLGSLRREQNREMYIEQLVPTEDPIRRIKINVFGSSGVGKSTLIGSLNCTYLNSFFRRTRLNSKNSSIKNVRKRNDLERINSITSINDLKAINKQQEEILTNNILFCSEEPKINILDNYELSNENYTKGIEISQCTLAGSHHFSIWEYSGYEPYYIFYDQYISGQNCINLVVYNLNQSQNECFKECVYWLEFLRARIFVKSKSQVFNMDTSNSVGSSSSTTISSSIPNSSSPIANEIESSPIGLSSIKFSNKVKILFIGTHADLDKSSNNNTTNKQKSADVFQSQYSYEKSNKVRQLLESYYSNDDLFDLTENHFVLDARAAWVSDIKQLIQNLIKQKQFICERLPRCTMFLNRTLFHIQNWRKSLNNGSFNLSNTTTNNQSSSSFSNQNYSFKSEQLYPVIRWKNFVEQIREEINPLASDDHLNELMQQLQLMGEVIFIRSDYDDDLICYQPEWLCNKILGRLFEHERFFEAKPQNLLGIFTQLELKEIFNDICLDVNLLKNIFVSMDLCAEVHPERINYNVINTNSDNLEINDMVYEFAAFNFLSEPLPLAFHNIKNFASSNKSSKKATQFVFNGFQIKCSLYHLERSRCLNSFSSMTNILTKSTANLMNESMTSSMYNMPFYSSSHLTPSQLASLFFRIQVNLRYLTTNSYMDIDDSINTAPNTLKEKAIHKISSERPILKRNQSKLDSLLELDLEPISFHNSSYPSTANGTTNILESPSLSSTNSPSRKSKAHLNLNNNGALIDVELYQTRYCSRLARKKCGIECLLSLDHINGEFIELRACAPESWREELFFFVQDLFGLIEQVIRDSYSNLNLERHYLDFKPVIVPDESNKDGLHLGLVNYENIYSPKDIIEMEYDLTKNKAAKKNFLDLICCGSEKIEKNLIHGIDLPFCQINEYTRRMLCAYLDKTDPMGRDWSILAFLLGLQDILPKLDEIFNAVKFPISKTECVLNEWCKKKTDEATVRYLISKIADLDRKDVYDLMLNTISLFQMKMSTDSGIQNSNQTLASLK